MRRTLHQIAFFIQWGGLHGWGHIVRSSALAGAFKAKGYACVLFSDSADPLPADSAEVFDAVYITPEWKAPRGLDQGYAAYVVDTYSFSREAIICLKKDARGPVVLIEDDLRGRHDGADFVIVGGLLGEGLSLPNGLTGLRYTLIRPQLQPSRENPEGGLIMIGGTDPQGITLRLAQYLREMQLAEPLTLVAPLHEHQSINRHLPQAHCLHGLRAAEMNALYNCTAWAISACGTTVYELALYGIPFVGIISADNQRQSAKLIAQHWKCPIIESAQLHCQKAQQAVKKVSAHPLLDPYCADIDTQGASRVVAAVLGF